MARGEMDMGEEIKLKKPLRQSNYELLRIISMIIIVAHHYAVHGGFATESLSRSALAIHGVIGSGGKLAVNIFVLISGYFLSSQSISLKKIIKLIVQVTFYSVLMYLLYIIFCGVGFNIRGIAKSFLVMFADSTYWFALTYFVMYLLTPFINAGLKNMEKKTLKTMLITFFVLWCLLSQVVKGFVPFGIRSYDYSALVWFIWLYSVGAYIRMYVDSEKCRYKKVIFFATGIAILVYIGAIVINTYISGTQSSSWIIKATGLLSQTLSAGAQNSLMPCLISVLLFLSFTFIKIPPTKWINRIGSATFGVYLIHDNGYFKQILWGNFLKNNTHTEMLSLIVHATVSVIVVFLVCTTIELIRINYFDKLFYKVIPIDKWCEKPKGDIL